MCFVLEHVKPVDKFPELAHDPSNQKPAHFVCNAKKGNREHANIIRRSGALK
jgi:5-methylcytosine-specific restriction endonuclease McrA